MARTPRTWGLSTMGIDGPVVGARGLAGLDDAD